MINKITGRHMEVTEAMHSYIEKKIDRIGRFYNRISEIEVILDGNGNGREKKVELIVKADHHSPFIVHESGDDMYACLDTAMDKVERQLTRHKEKSRNHKGQVGAAEATAEILQQESETETEE